METIVNYLTRAFLFCGGAALLILVLLATGNVASRLFGIPFAGTYEIVSFLGALVTAGALAYTQLRHDHIMVDIVTDRFPPRVKQLLDAVSDLLAAVLFGIVTWQLYRWGEKIQLAGEKSETLQLTFYPFIYGVAAGFALLTLVLLLQTARSLRPAGEKTP
jgi:TRAP-type C4-dicarboxylate transport system permease small subunit